MLECVQVDSSQKKISKYKFRSSYMAQQGKFYGKDVFSFYAMEWACSFLEIYNAARILKRPLRYELERKTCVRGKPVSRHIKQ